VVEQWKPMVICAALVVTSQAPDFMLTGYLPTYLKVVVHIGNTAGLVMIVATLAILMAAVVFVAMLSDRIGVKPIMWTGCGLLVVASVPAFLLMRSGAIFPLVFIGVLLIGLMELCFDSTAPAALPALFPTRVRNGALAISYNIALSTVGGTTPLIAQTLISGTGNALVPAYMLIFAGLVGAITLLFMPEVAGKPLPGSAPSVESEAGEMAGA
jgi:MHS family proline/betaine transporter-like MFS transporter